MHQGSNNTTFVDLLNLLKPHSDSTKIHHKLRFQLKNLHQIFIQKKRWTSHPKISQINVQLNVAQLLVIHKKIVSLIVTMKMFLTSSCFLLIRQWHATFTNFTAFQLIVCPNSFEIL